MIFKRDLAKLFEKATLTKSIEYLLSKMKDPQDLQESEINAQSIQHLMPLIISQSLSYHIWEKIKFFAENYPIGNIGETTFTDEIVYRMNQIKSENVHIYKAKNENTNGADIELIISYRSGSDKDFIAYPLQAKLIKFSGENNYIDGKYSGFLRKKDDNESQVQKIIDYAAKITECGKKAIPLHLLYSYSSNANFHSAWKPPVLECFKNKSEDYDKFEDYHWGCSVISSKTIGDLCNNKEQVEPKLSFSELHDFFSTLYQPALPWSILFCPTLDEANLKSLFESEFKDSAIKDYLLKEEHILEMNKNYVRIKGSGTFDGENNEKMNDKNINQPKYRIIVNIGDYISINEKK